MIFKTATVLETFLRWPLCVHPDTHTLAGLLFFQTSRLPLALPRNIYTRRHFPSSLLLPLSLLLQLLSSSALTPALTESLLVATPPPSFLHAGDPEVLTCHVNKRRKKGARSCGGAESASAAPISCVRTENSDLVWRWHVYGWWAQASDFASRDCTLAPGPSHLEHEGL